MNGERDEKDPQSKDSTSPAAEPRALNELAGWQLAGNNVIIIGEAFGG
jgi:hypothetical protein